MNSVNFVGRWVREHEVHEGNTTVVKNTLAVDHPFKKDSASFPRIVMFGKTGELANQYTGKGSQVAISGYLETGSYEKTDGTKVFTTDIIANSIKFLDSKESRSDSQNNAPAQQHGASKDKPDTYQGKSNAPPRTNYKASDDPFQTGSGPVEVSDDDLPF